MRSYLGRGRLERASHARRREGGERASRKEEVLRGALRGFLERQTQQGSGSNREEGINRGGPP